MSKLLKITLIVFIILTVQFGLPLLAMPGRFLGLFGWAPVEPLLCRMFGAALLGLGWSAARTWHTHNRERAQAVIEAGAVFCTLAAVGMIWNMLGAGWPLMVWVVLGIYIILAVLWVWNWVKK